jgi:hypothetical protein
MQIKIFKKNQYVLDVSKYSGMVESFAEAMCKDENYMNYMLRQRGASKDKIFSNIADSKYPECAVNDFLINEFKFPKVENNPDFEIYKKGKKSWAPDLSYDLEKAWTDISNNKKLNIGVKSCTTDVAKNYGASYVFNIGTYSSPNTIEDAVSGVKHSGCDHLFTAGTDSDVIAFVIYNTHTYECEIRGFANWKFLINDWQNAFKPLRLPRFNGIKAAVYEDYLKHYI